jgi:Arylsulfotransferase (ASST)/Secretion system C-terminal sorting domain
LDIALNVVFQWRSWDNFNITDAIHEDLTGPVVDYVHINAIDVDADGDLLLSSRHLDEITKIDHETGAVLWRLGGRNNQFTFTDDSIGFSHQHAIRRIANGHITLFDNGNYHNPQFSRALEYELDETNRTATLVWQYRHSPDLYGEATGYVQRFENGNTLIGWGATNPSVTEVRPDGSTALELSLLEGVFTYRAIRFPWPPGIQAGVTDRSLPSSYSLEQNYPNPFNPTTTIRFTIAGSGYTSLVVYDILGRTVTTLVDGYLTAGDRTAKWDASRFGSGVYFYKLMTEGFTQTKKLVLLR